MNLKVRTLKCGGWSNFIHIAKQSSKRKVLSSFLWYHSWALLKLSLQSNPVLLISSFLFFDYPFSHPSLPSSVLWEFQLLWVSLSGCMLDSASGKALEGGESCEGRLVWVSTLTVLAMAPFLCAHKSCGLCLLQRPRWTLRDTHLPPRIVQASWCY